MPLSPSRTCEWFPASLSREIYDFEDNWTHLITLEKKISAKPGETKPTCLAGRRMAPSENGIWSDDPQINRSHFLIDLVEK